MSGIRVPLNLYLLKSGKAPADAVPSLAQADAPAPSDGADADGDETVGWVRTWVLGDNPAEAPLPDSLDDLPQASALVRATPARASWQTVMGEMLPESPLETAQANYGALLFQEVGTALVVWSWGNAWSLLDPSATVDRFGLKAGLNALLTSLPPAGGSSRQVGVRGLTSAVRAAVVRKSTVVAARPSSPTTMERVDQASDAAAMAELTTHHKIFDRAAAGRSLRFEATVSGLADLKRYAKEALRLYRRSDYQSDDGYKWIDYTVPVGDRSEVDAVLDQLLKAATATNPIDVDMVWADADDSGLTPSFACLPRERSGPGAARRTEMPWPAALAWMKVNCAGEPGSSALRTPVRFFHDGPAPSLATQVELWQLLVAQVTLSGKTYMVSDGEIWQASASHIADIDALLTPNLVVNPAWLPRYSAGETEDSYNRRAASHGSHFLLDKTLVRLPGQSPFEPCDLLSYDGLLMHVKRRSSSSTMSHVTAQATAAAQLLRSDALARTKLDDVLTAASPAPPRLADMRSHIASFAVRTTATTDVVIVGSWRGAPDVSQIPLLTRITLNSWIRQSPCPARVILVGT